jgi:hypothetical protein
MSKILDIKPIKELQFPDFNGAIKSLGAWGGDFILASTNAGANYVKTYFRGKGCETVFQYDDIVMNVPFGKNKPIPT